MNACKLLLSTISAAVLLAALAGSASARNFSSTSQTFRVAFRTVTVRGMFGVSNCPLTLEGSLHARTISKVNDNLVGYITRAVRGACGSEASTTVLTETLPWPLRYGTFTSALPNITSITLHILEFSYRIQELLRTCLVRSSGENRVVFPILRDTTSRALTTAELIGNVITDCGTNAVFSSTRDPVTVLNSSSRITITLI